jgi:hypothetical protein
VTLAELAGMGRLERRQFFNKANSAPGVVALRGTHAAARAALADVQALLAGGTGTGGTGTGGGGGNYHTQQLARPQLHRPVAITEAFKRDLLKAVHHESLRAMNRGADTGGSAAQAASQGRGGPAAALRAAEAKGQLELDAAAAHFA